MSKSKPINYLCLSARSEIKIELGTNSKLKQGILERTELTQDCYIPNCIVTNNNNKIRTIAINTSNTDRIIPKPTVMIEPLIKKKTITPLNELTDGKTNNLDRWKKILQNLRTEHCSKEERKRLLEIIKKIVQYILFSWRSIIMHKQCSP